jgi:hypothetical protein
MLSMHEAFQALSVLIQLVIVRLFILPSMLVDLATLSAAQNIQGWMIVRIGLQFVKHYVKFSLPVIITLWRNQFILDRVEALNGVF